MFCNFDLINKPVDWCAELSFLAKTDFVKSVILFQDFSKCQKFNKYTPEFSWKLFSVNDMEHLLLGKGLIFFVKGLIFL